MFNINIIPNNVFTVNGFEVRIKQGYTCKQTYRGVKNVKNYMLYTPYKNGWRVCDAVWDKQHYELPQVNFYYIAENICVPFDQNRAITENAKRNIAAICDIYDKQLTLQRQNGHANCSVESALVEPCEMLTTEKSARNEADTFSKTMQASAEHHDSNKYIAEVLAQMEEHDECMPQHSANNYSADVDGYTDALEIL